MTEYGITMRRVIDAPRERVWQEWTEPERFADWFGGPEAEIPLETMTMDVRPGGAWRATMFDGPDRRVIEWRGQFLEVVPPERLVLTFSVRPDEVYELVTVVLNDLGSGAPRCCSSSVGTCGRRSTRSQREVGRCSSNRMEARLWAQVSDAGSV